MRIIGFACALLLAAPASAGDIVVTLDVAFGPAAHERMNVFTPAEANDTTPVLVFFFGGGWQMGSKDALGSLGQDLARNGVILIAPTYRLWPEVTFPTFLDDCTAAVAHVAKTRTLGGRRPLFVGGWSAGAYNALAVGLDQDRLIASGIDPAAISGVIGLAGPYSGGLCAGRPCPEVFPPDSKDDRPVVRLIDPEDPPLLLLAADRDGYVDISQFETIRTAATAASLDVMAQVVAGSHHRSLLRHLAEAGTAERDLLDGFLARQISTR